MECSVLVMANGLWVPNTHPNMRGIELVTGYEELPKSGEIFEGKSVAILGMGNSAFEIANAAADYANYVHIWPTRSSGQVDRRARRAHQAAQLCHHLHGHLPISTRPSGPLRVSPPPGCRSTRSEAGRTKSGSGRSCRSNPATSARPAPSAPATSTAVS